ncbi:MAG TPA: ATP-binding protein [Rhodocyclaceae bacterium]|nr:ATP-binding protein [Rhodocyclaceae bacterium]
MDQALAPTLQSRLSQLQRRRRDHADDGRRICALTERRQVDRRRPGPDLQHREYRLRSVAQAAGVGVFDLDYADAGDYFSPELRAILGLPEEGGELSVMQVIALVHPEDRERVAAKLEASLDSRGDGFFDDEHRLLLADGTIRWVRVRGRTFFAEDEVRHPLGTTGIVVDVTRRKEERKAAEAKVRGLNAELEQRVKKRTAELQRANDALLRSNLELRHFAHAAAHDLQTPLRSIAGFAQLLQQEVKGRADSRVDEWAGLVVDNAKRLQNLIHDLLAYTRLDVQGLPFTAVDLQKLFSEVRSSLGGLIRDTGAEVTSDSLPTVLADRTQIAQLLQNLVENGIKYNRSQPPRVEIACRRQGAEWLFSVRDNGIGIDPRHHDRIFEIFRRLHSYSQVPGTGIGLALCRRIVERHGGRIWVESEPGAGSVFHFTLPIRTRLA